jgi:DNA-binding NarL/FixJ family response regulator
MLRGHPRYLSATSRPFTATAVRNDWPVWSVAPHPSLTSTNAEPTDEVTVALIGGQRLPRDATATLLARQQGLRMIGTFASATQYASAGSPAEVVLLDCEETEPEHWEQAIAVLRGIASQCRSILLCGESREDAIRFAMAHGLNGVILKSYTATEIGEAIRFIATGRTVMPAGWQRLSASALEGPAGLSPRQREILALLAQGRGNEQIADALELSPNTVKSHIRELYSRLGVRNRVEAAKQYALMTRGGD